MKIISVIVSSFILIIVCPELTAQSIKWAKDGNSYYRMEGGEVAQYKLPGNMKSIAISKKQLTPEGQTKQLTLRSYQFAPAGSKLLIYTNSKKVWRLDTRGDYWLLDSSTGILKQLGKSRPPSSLMFAKLSPDGSKVAYVSDYNLYVEDLSENKITPLTVDGNRKFINGTFDWAYEEEFFCRDGFRWSPDGKHIAFWQIDARKVKDYLMINNTDSAYPVAVPVEYPVAGELPSPARIGVINVSTGKITWMEIPYNTQQGSYIPRMEWAGTEEIIVQHLNRKQNESTLLICNVSTGKSNAIYSEKDAAWIDILPLWDQDYSSGGWDWLNGGKEFLWASEKDGWRHLYRISKDGKKETLITKGNYDVMDISSIDEKSGYVYFFASPLNATQKYLYRVKLDGKGKEERLSPINQPGYHGYNVSPTGKFASHSFSNHSVPAVNEWISLPDHKGLNGENKVNEAISKSANVPSNVEFFTVKTADGVEMDAWMVRPVNFDSTKKYPVLFYVYTEPWGQEVKDQYGIAGNFLYQGDLAKEGYFYIAIDNRGTPVPKGRAWRKSVYRKIGLVNISDQAMAAKEILKWPFLDTSRVAVWGWSGGGSATLNLMFQYPDIYKTGISVAAVGNQLTYDNIYQERYMGLPEENKEDFLKGSPITYAKNLKGHLLYIHGTGDDNVHYQNAELLLNELVKYNRQFQFMPYPNRTHGISEGEGTFRHLSTLYTNFLRTYCPPGGR
ncbi:MAG TPA: S9 family peptidase [Flavitalea sp.]|nr:S9 family peptidase [Flavitalea sp.]